MKLIYEINTELLEILNSYRDWIFKPDVQLGMEKRMALSKPKFKLAGTPAESCSVATLMGMNHDFHDGFPVDFYGIDLNYKNVQNESAQFEPDFFNEVRDMNRSVDDKLQGFLGARACALKAFYPVDGYISWHTNWNVPGYVLIFTYSQTGKGFWRHVDSSSAAGLTPNPDKIVQVGDSSGWHCKAGYFGGKSNPQEIVWHCAYSAEPRITLSYLFQDRSVWDDVLAEIAGQ